MCNTPKFKLICDSCNKEIVKDNFRDFRDLLATFYCDEYYNTYCCHDCARQSKNNAHLVNYHDICILHDTFYGAYE